MTDNSVPASAGEVEKAPAPAPQTSEPAGRRGTEFWLKWGAMGVAALVVAAFLGAYVLPRKPEVTRSIDIAVPRVALFPLVADLRHLPEWSPLLTADPDIVVTFTGPLDGVGQAIAWQSRQPQVGSGRETITAITPDSSVEMRLDRAGQPETVAWFRLTEKSANETTVVWGYRKDVGFTPIDRYRALGLDGIVGPGYERGLKRLKAYAERPPASHQPPKTN